MATSVDDINRWLAAPSEHERLEFKEAKQQYNNEKLFKYCVALANEGGGLFVLGVSDAKPRKVVGTNAFNNPVEMAAKVYRTLKFRVEMEEVEHPDGRVLIFHVPSRPRGVAREYQGAYWMRIGEELTPMSPEQLRGIFTEDEEPWLDTAAVEGASAQDVVQLLDTQTFFDLLGLPYPTERSGVLAKLKAERLIDEQSGGFVISKLAAVLLAKNLRNFDRVYRKAPRVVVYNGNNKLETTSDTTGGKGYAVGFQGLVEHVMGHLPQNEVISDALRRETKLLPDVVIRELLANALIHQDFTISGASPMVEIYADRVEISNPGEPIVPLERLIDAYRSRNERLADLMRRFGICEEKGSGIDRTVKAAEVHQLPPPDFQLGVKRTHVVVFGPKPFKRMERGERIRACYQHCALQYVLKGQMTNQTLRERFKLSDGSAATVSQIITATIDAGLIKPDPDAPPGRRFSRYLPAWA